MSGSSSASPLEVTVHPGRPPLLEVDTGGDAARWASDRAQDLRGVVAEHGAVLVRGLGLGTRGDVAAVVAGLEMSPMGDQEAFAAREAHAGGVYSSSTWPRNQQMCMHHEQSYTLEFPGLMLFSCLTAPAEGGATTIADAAAVLEALPAELVERFDREGWVLVRNYTDEIGMSVGEAFGTEDRSVVETYCRANAIDHEWLPEGGLRTRQRRPAVVRHPISGARCWFNQIAFLSEWTMNPEVHEFLVDLYGAEGLPFNTRYGNGDPIEQDVVDTINDVYDANTLREPWQAGDLLAVDNVRTAHSREPYVGDREVVVAMGDRVRLADLTPSVL